MKLKVDKVTPGPISLFLTFVRKTALNAGKTVKILIKDIKLKTAHVNINRLWTNKMTSLLKHNKGKAKKMTIGIIKVDMFKYLGRNWSQTSDKRSSLNLVKLEGIHSK